MKIGIYGGSFDPVHNGHIAMIRSALKSGFIDCMIVIPSVRNNFKLYANKLPAPYRLYMMKETVEGLGLKNCYVSDIEFGIDGVSYTAVVLAKLTSDDYIRDFLLANDLSEVHEIILIHLSGNNSNPEDFSWFISRETGKLTYVAKKGFEIDIDNEPY